MAQRASLAGNHLGQEPLCSNICTFKVQVLTLGEALSGEADAC